MSDQNQARILYRWKTVGHIPREISRYVYFFIKEEGGRVYGKLKSLKYKPPITAGGLEVPLLLKFEAQGVRDAMEEFVENSIHSISQGI